MKKNLNQWKEAAIAARTLVFGDIHGCLSQFDAILAAVAPLAEDHLILLGDCVDRGADSGECARRRQAVAHFRLLVPHDKMISPGGTLTVESTDRSFLTQ